MRLHLHVLGNESKLVEKISLFHEQPLENVLLLNIIRKDEKVVGLKSKSDIQFTISFTQDNAAWEAKNIDIDTIKYKGKPCYIIQDMEVQRVNRRAAYREFIGGHMYISIITSCFESAMVEVRDISATGFAFYSKDDIAIGSKLVLKLRYYTICESLTGEIVRKVDDGARKLYGCKLDTNRQDLGKIMARIQREKMHNKK